MASVQQICDLYANQQLKTILKDLYYEFRMTLDLSEQTKVKVPREIFVTWVECAFKQVHDAQPLQMDTRLMKTARYLTSIWSHLVRRLCTKWIFKELFPPFKNSALLTLQSV